MILHVIRIELNSNSIENNGMQIDTKDIENHLMVMMLKKIFLKNINMERHKFHSFFTIRNQLNRFQFGIEFIKF
jgi:hypothetical protein